MSQPTKAQNILKIISTINLVLGVLSIVAGLLVTVGGGVMAFQSPLGSSEEANGAIGFIAGIILLLSGIADVVGGIFGRRAAVDNTKIMPAWWFADICLVLSVVGLIDMFVEGNATVPNIITGLVGLAFNVALYAYATTVKEEAGL